MTPAKGPRNERAETAELDESHPTVYSTAEPLAVAAVGDDSPGFTMELNPLDYLGLPPEFRDAEDRESEAAPVPLLRDEPWDSHRSWEATVTPSDAEALSRGTRAGPAADRPTLGEPARDPYQPWSAVVRSELTAPSRQVESAASPAGSKPAAPTPAGWDPHRGWTAKVTGDF